MLIFLELGGIGSRLMQIQFAVTRDARCWGGVEENREQREEEDMMQVNL